MKNSVLWIIIFMVLILIIVITVLIVKKSNNYFESNKKYTTAVIDGKSTDSSSTNVILTVKIAELNSEYSYDLEGLYNVKKSNGQLNTKYPYFSIGDEVYIEYAQKKVMGISVVDVRLREELYDYPI